MKNLIRIIILAAIASGLSTACAKRSKTDTAKQQPIADSAIETAHETTRGRIIEDTVIGRWAVKTSKDSNDVVVKYHDWAVRDSSVFLTLSYDKKKVYTDKEIRTKDVVGNEGEFIMYSGGYVFWASDAAIYLSFGCYVPESDVGWNMLYQVLPDGTSNITVVQEEMGVDCFDVVASFMPLYLNERAAGASAPDLKRIFEHYCTREVADALSDGTIRIVPDDADFRHADRTTLISNLDDLSGLPLEKYSFEVEFKPYLKDENITDIIYLEIDDAANKISKIETGFRKTV